jgi:RNA polymerase sigma-70 factor (ECF subfamily)
VVGRPLDERELVARAQRGDADAYEELVRAYQGIAFRTAYVLAGSAADAEEAAQDGFVKAYRALWRFRAGAAFKPWLLRIVANEARNRRRAAGRRTALALRAAQVPSGEAAPSPEAALLDTERRGQLMAALERLSESDREAIACRYFLDLSEAETAAALGVRRGTVKSRVSRALDRLRAELEAASVAGQAGDARPENVGEEER